MLSVGYETAIPASERPQTHALNCAATAIGICDVEMTEVTLIAISQHSQYLNCKVFVV
jgi:hypothetical protein